MAWLVRAATIPKLYCKVGKSFSLAIFPPELSWVFYATEDESTNIAKVLKDSLVLVLFFLGVLRQDSQRNDNYDKIFNMMNFLVEG